MEEDVQLWSLAHEVLRALGQQYYPVMEARAAEAGLGQCDWYLLLPALTFDPEPISTKKLLVRVPFYAPHIYENRLQKLADLGYLSASALEQNGNDFPRYEYNLTESGRMTIQWIIQAADVEMQRLHPLALPELERLAEYLRRIVKACEVAPVPPGKWSLALSRKTDHANVAPVVVRIDQYLTDLNAYRDDCRLAAWKEDPQTAAVSPPAWEVLTQLWKVAGAKEDGGYSLKQLHNMLERRGHSRQAYADALKELDKLGWVSARERVYRVTDAGHQAREAARHRTDQYFYRPWNSLSPAELAELKKLLVAAWDGMKVRLNNGKKSPAG